MKRLSLSRLVPGALLLALAWNTPVSAQDVDAAAEMARKMQNPLANIRALITDNAVGFGTGNTDGTSYGFQFQPVYAIGQPQGGFTFLPRAVVPVLGLEPGTKIPPIGAPTQSDTRAWGLGDTIIQGFLAPYVESSWKWGIGPQVLLPTATTTALEGPRWGLGVAGVVTGNITPQISFAGIIGNHWGDSGNFNTMTIQPMVFYNVESVPGVSIGYNAVISADWNATGSNRWTVPLGLTFGRTLDMGGGNGLDLNIGPYFNIVKPDGGARWALRFGVSWLYP
jgi:hypothetical protein